MNRFCHYWDNPWTPEDTLILSTPLYLMGDSPVSPEERDASIMRHMARESLFQRIEQQIDLGYRRLMAVHIATITNLNPGPYEPGFSRGDLMVTFRGYSLGSRSWTENWGTWRPELRGVV
jgi:hypothetical protein